MSEELLGCPFCGVSLEDHLEREFYHPPTDCVLDEISFLLQDGPGDWNRRAPATKEFLPEQVKAVTEAARRVVAHYNIVHRDMPDEMRAFSGGVALIGALEKALIPLDPSKSAYCSARAMRIDGKEPTDGR